MIDTSKIIKKYGTPTYVFDIEKLHKRIEYLKEKFGKDIDLVYAVKANTFIAKELENNISKYEICSPGEFDICNKLGINREKMVISGVYKDKETIERMIISYDDINRFTIESLEQFKLLEKTAKKYKKKINVLIRLTSGNQFGINEEDFKYILENYSKDTINIKGIEYFSGTQKHSIKRINKEIDYLINLISETEKEYKITFEELEYGPGLPIYYFIDDDFDEDSFLNQVKEALDKIKNKKVLLEIGRSIAASCGYYLTKVVDLKSNKNGNFAILDGGIHHLVYYGGNMAMRVPHFELISSEKSEKMVYNLYGSLCTINDVLVKNIELNKLNIGDIFVFKNTGAYSVTEGISLFLSRDLPKVVIINKNKMELVRDTVNTSSINFPNYK